MKQEYFTLADGHQMPKQGFGVYKITDQATLDEAIQAAFDAGYRLFDTAQMYGNEAMLGNALAKLPAKREELFITTKISEANQGYDTTIASFKESLKQLQLDYVDLLLLHWPIHETFFDSWRALEDLKAAGLVKSIGTSNYGMIHLQYLATQAREMPVVNQLERHPWFNQAAMLKFDRQHDIVTQAWAPLGRGRMMDEPVLTELATKHQKSPAQIILRWQYQSGISFIPKSAHAERIVENAAIYDFELSPAEMTMIDELNRNTRISQEPELVYELNHQYPHN